MLKSVAMNGERTGRAYTLCLLST